jgi:hypothetical protein
VHSLRHQQGCIGVCAGASILPQAGCVSEGENSRTAARAAGCAAAAAQELQTGSATGQL